MTRRITITAVVLLVALTGTLVHRGITQEAAVAERTELDELCSRIQRESGTVSEGDVVRAFQMAKEEGRPFTAAIATKGYLSRQRETGDELALAAIENAYLTGNLRGAVSRSKSYLGTANPDKVSSDVAARMCAAQIDFLGASDAAYRYMAGEGKMFRRSFAARKFDGWFLNQARARRDYVGHAGRLGLILKDLRPPEEEKVHYWHQLDWLMSQIKRPSDKSHAAAATCKELATLIRGDEGRKARCGFLAENLAFSAAAKGKSKADLDADFKKVTAAAQQYVAKSPTSGAMMDVLDTFGGSDPSKGFADAAQGAAKRDFFVQSIGKLPAKDRDQVLSWKHHNRPMAPIVASPEQWTKLAISSPNLFSNPEALTHVPFTSRAKDKNTYVQLARVLDGVHSPAAAAIKTLAAADTPAAAADHLYRNESWYLREFRDFRNVYAGRILPALKAMSGKTGKAADVENARALIEFDRKYLAGTPAALDVNAVRDYIFNAWRHAPDKSKMAEYVDAVSWVPFNAADRNLKRSRMFEQVDREFGGWANNARNAYNSIKREAARYMKSLPAADKRTPDQKKKLAELDARLKKAEKDANDIATIGQSLKNARNDKAFAPERAPNPLCRNVATAMSAAYAGDKAGFAKAVADIYPSVRDYRTKKTPLGHAIMKFLAKPPREVASIDQQAQMLSHLLMGWQTGKQNPDIEDIATAIMTSRRHWNWWSIPERDNGSAMAKKLNAAIEKELLARMDKGEWDRKLFDWLRATRRGDRRERDMGWNKDLFLRVLKEQKVDVGTMMYLARAEWRLGREYSTESYFDDAFVKEALEKKWLDAQYWNHGGQDRQGKVRSAAAKVIAGYASVPLGYGGGKAYAPGDFWRWQDEAIRAKRADRDAMLAQVESLYGKTRFDVHAMGRNYFYYQGNVKSAEGRNQYFTKLAEYLNRASKCSDRPSHPSMARLSDIGSPDRLTDAELTTLARMFDHSTRPWSWPRGNYYENLAIYTCRGLLEKDRERDVFAMVPHLWRIVRESENQNAVRALAEVARESAKNGKWEIASALSNAGLEVCKKLSDTDRNSLTQIRAKALSNFDVIPVSPSDPRYPVYAAQAHYMTGNFAQAWDNYTSSGDKVMSMFKELDPSFVMWLIDRNTSGGQFDKAESLARTMIQWMDTTPDALPPEARLGVMLSYANIAFSKPEYPRAKAIYGQIATAREFDGMRGQVDAELRMAEIELKTGQPDESIARLESLLKKQDNYIQTEANYHLAKVHFEGKDFTAALEKLNEVFSFSPNHPLGKILEGQVKLAIRRIEEATHIEVGLKSEQEKIVPGKPLRVTVEDQTLSVVGRTTEIKIRAWTDSGDEEIFTLRPFADSRTRFAGEILTQLAPIQKGDTILQVLGDDKVRYDFAPTFKKEHNITDAVSDVLRTVSDSELYVSSGNIVSKEEAEKRAMEQAIKAKLGLDQQRGGQAADPAKGILLSEARAGDQIKPGNKINVRVIDKDRSTTASNDVVDVKVTASSGDSIVAFALTETETHSAVFESAIPTEPAPAAAFATDSEEGADPAFAISSGDHPAWVARPDGKKPKSFTADLNDNVLFGPMKVTANVPGRKIKNFTLQSSQNGVSYRTIGGWPDAYKGWDGAPKATVAKLASGAAAAGGGRRRGGGGSSTGVDVWATKPLSQIKTVAMKNIHANWAGDVLGQAGALGIDAQSTYMVYVKAAFYAPKRIIRTFRLKPSVMPDPAGAQAILSYDFRVNGESIAGPSQQRGEVDPDVEPPPPWNHRAVFKKGVHTLEVIVTASAKDTPAFEVLCDTNEAPYMVPCPAEMFDPAQHPEILEGIKEPVATVQPVEDGGAFDITFSEGARGRALRMIMHDFETDAPAINKIALQSAEGKEILPTKADLLELRHNKTLEIIPGDQVVISYRDPIGIAKDGIVHERFLAATYSDGDIGAGLVVGYVLDADGMRKPELAKLYRYDPGDTIDITVRDPDNDTSDEQDIVEFQVKTFGEKPVTLKAQETGPHSGVFAARIFPVEHDAKRESEIKVKEGDDIELFYRDVENLDPGVPWVRTARIERNWYQDPEFRAYDIVTESLADQAERAAAGGRRAAPARRSGGRDGEVEENIKPMYALVATRPDSPEEPEQAARAVVRGPVLAEVYWPTIAKSSVSKASIFVQTSAGREKYEQEIPEGTFDVNVPGTIKLTSGLGGGAAMPIPTGYSGCTVVGQPEDELGGIGTFMFSVPTAPGAPQEETMITAGEEGGPDESEAVLKIKGNDKVYVGFKYADEEGEEHWVSREIELTPPGALLDIMTQDYLATLTNVHVGKSAYLRAIDASKDLTEERDRLSVALKSSSGHTNMLQMTETFAHSGVFKGTVKFLHSEDEIPTNTLGLLPVTYGATVMATYAPSNDMAALERSVNIFKGSDGSVMPFSKKFKDPSIAVRTQLAIAEAWFELAKQHRRLKQKALSRREIAEGKRVLEEAIKEYPDTETRAQADYLLANLSMEFAEDAGDKATKKKFYKEAVLRFRDIVAMHPDTTYAPRAQYKYALALEKLGDFDNACEEYVKLSYRWPDNELIAETVARLGQYFYRKGRRLQKLADTKEDPIEKEKVMIKVRDHFTTAAQVFGRLIVKFPSHSLAEKTKVLSGQCYMRAEKFDDAVRAFRVITDNKEANKDVRAEAMYWCGDSYLKKVGIGLEEEGEQAQRRGPARGADPGQDPVVQAYRMFKNLTWDYPATKWAKYARARLAEEQFAQVEQE